MAKTAVADAVLGTAWLEKKLEQARKVEQQARDSAKKGTHSYLTRKPFHPVIQWKLLIEKAIKNAGANGEYEPSEALLKYAVLGQSLELTRSLKGFERLAGRLKDPAAFRAAVFESEVAARYVSMGWNVEFVEEGESRSPDLKVTTPEGLVVWVECKCRDELTERDGRIAGIRDRISAGLMRVLGPKKANCAVLLHALEDPEEDDVERVICFVIAAAMNGGVGHIDRETGAHAFEAGPTGRWRVIVQNLAPADLEIPATQLVLEGNSDWDQIVLGAEVMMGEGGISKIRNPHLFAFKNEIASDTVSGILHGLKSAVGQIPKEGPGIVWIRVPDNVWHRDFEGSFSQAEKLVRSELSGGNNRRISAVGIVTRFIDRQKRGEKIVASYPAAWRIITHSDPRVGLANV